jgi:hypothetical protein
MHGSFCELSWLGYIIVTRRDKRVELLRAQRLGVYSNSVMMLRQCTSALQFIYVLEYAGTSTIGNEKTRS